MVEIFQVDAFTDHAFGGNPAGVCILKKDASAEWKQQVAAEMNLSETAFVRRLDEQRFALQWFTPTVEVELCGHATLATAHVLWQTDLVDEADSIFFETRSGVLTCKNMAGKVQMNFPANAAHDFAVDQGIIDCLGVNPIYTGKNTFDLLIEVASENEVRRASVDFNRLREEPVRGVILTSRSEKAEFDFVSRFFAPASGVDEDPVTGSAHCCLGPYWGPKIGKTELVGFQASHRGGKVNISLADDRVFLLGQAVTVLRGSILV